MSPARILYIFQWWHNTLERLLRKSYYLPLRDVPAQRCRRDQNDHFVVSNKIAPDPLCLLNTPCKGTRLAQKEKITPPCWDWLLHSSLYGKNFFIHRWKFHSLKSGTPFWTTAAGLVEERVGSLEYGCYFIESKIRGRCNLTIKQWFLQLSKWKDSISIKNGKQLQTVTYLKKCTKA